MVINAEGLPGTAATGRLKAEHCNSACRDVTLDRAALRAELAQYSDGAALYRMMTEDRPYLFAEVPVFVAEDDIQRQTHIIDAVEQVVASLAYRQHVLAYAPTAARFTPKAQGVFLGYDFHVDSDGPRLIEINSNAGGPLLNALLARAQTSGDTNGERWPERDFPAMFLEEWRLERGTEPLRRIAIVDEDPQNQFLLPEFLLFQHLFTAHGIDALLCDPAKLELRDDGLYHGKRRIDLIYNRLTDFGLTAATSRNIRSAYLDGTVVVTPHPRNHALYADKRNLVLLTDAAALREMGVDDTTRAWLLNGIAHTSQVRREDADALWAARKRLFFKPAAGYGSKAAYRGDKLTRRVFEDILQGDYVAQSLVSPSKRCLNVGTQTQEFKLDLRHYVYRGRTQLIASRLYQGQTTNFRTPGGGFAPVIVLP